MHGNGLVLYKDNKVTFIKKGLEYTNKQIARKILNSDFDYCQYHTRVVSVSTKSDKNCHPFYTKRKDLVLMMNGTEREIGNLSAPIGITDTEMVFRMLRDYDIPIKALEKMSARYMGFTNGKVFICNSVTNSLRYIRDKNAFVVASSFPKLIKDEKLKTGLWVQGDKIQSGSAYNSYSPSYRGSKSYQPNSLLPSERNKSWWEKEWEEKNTKPVISAYDKQTSILDDIPEDEVEDVLDDEIGSTFYDDLELCRYR